MFNKLTRAYFGNMLDGFEDLYNIGKMALWPAADVRDEEKKFVVEVELPGVRPEEISVAVEGEQLVVSGEKRIEKKRTGRFSLYERSEGNFVRKFYLNDGVDASKIEATYKDGVLIVEVPKLEKKTLAKKISIKY